MFQKVVFNGDSIATNIPVDHLVRKKLLLEKNHSFQRPLTAQVVESRTKTLSKYKDFVSVIKSYDHLLSCFRNFTSKIPEGLIELESMIQLMQFSHVYEKYIKQAQMRCSSVNCGPNFRSITKTSQIYKDGFKGMCEWAKFVAIFNDTIQKGHLPYKNGFETIFYKALFYVHRVKVLMEAKGLDADFSYSEVLEILKKTKKLYNYTMKIFQKPISIRFNSFKFGRYSNRINKLQNMISKLYDNQLPKSLIAGVTEINRIRIPWTSSVTNIGLLMTAACNFKFDISLIAQAIYIFNRELNNIHRKLKLPFEVELEEGWISKSKSKSETTINSRTSTLGADHHNIDEFHYDEGDNDSVSSDIRKIRHVNEVIDEILVVIHSTGEDNSKAPEPTYISKPPLVDENAKTFTEDFGFKPESSDFHEDNAEESSDNKCKPIHEMCDKNELNVTELNIEEVSAGKSLTIDEFTKSKGGLNKDDINKTEMSIDEIDSKSDVGQSGISDLENEGHTDEINALNVADTNINSLEDQKTNVAIVPTEENDVTNENEDSTFNRSAELDIKVEVSAIDENEDATSNKSARLDINVETILTDENEDATFNRSAELDIKVEASAIDENEDATSIKSAKLDIKLEASVIDEFGDTTSNKSAELDIKETTLKDENEDTTSNKPAELDIKETSLIDEIEDTTFNKSAELDIKETTLIDENEGATSNKPAELDIEAETALIDENEDATFNRSAELDIKVEVSAIDENEDTTSNKSAELDIELETTLIDENEDATFNRSAELDIKVEVSAIDENEDATSNKSARLDINVETAVRDEFEDNTSNKSAEIDINVETTLIDENEDVVSNKPAELDIKVEAPVIDEFEDTTSDKSVELDIELETTLIDEIEDTTFNKPAELDIKLEASVIDEFEDTTLNKSAKLDIEVETTLKDENEGATSNKPAELDIKETTLVDEIEGATFNKSAEPDIKLEAPVIDEFEDTTSDKSVELDIELETTLIDEIEDTTSNKPAEFEIKAETTVIDEIEDDFVEDFDE